MLIFYYNVKQRELDKPKKYSKNTTTLRIHNKKNEKKKEKKEACKIVKVEQTKVL